MSLIPEWVSESHLTPRKPQPAVQPSLESVYRDVDLPVFEIESCSYPILSPVTGSVTSPQNPYTEVCTLHAAVTKYKLKDA